MSEVGIASDRFWSEFKSEVAGTLSDEQRGEIERVVGATAPPTNSAISDLRLSFKWFFVRLAWGPEKRSEGRVQQEQTRGGLGKLLWVYGWFVALLLVALVVCAKILSYII